MRKINLLAGRLTFTLYKSCSCQNVLESLCACVLDFCLTAMMMMFSGIYCRVYMCLNREEALLYHSCAYSLSRRRNTKQQKNKSALSACLVKKYSSRKVGADVSGLTEVKVILQRTLMSWCQLLHLHLLHPLPQVICDVI